MENTPSPAGPVPIPYPIVTTPQPGPLDNGSGQATGKRQHQPIVLLRLGT